MGKLDMQAYRMMMSSLLCQLYVVLFIALHDRLRLGSLNNLLEFVPLIYHRHITSQFQKSM